MSYDFAYPAQKLKPYIKQYWAIENVVKNGEDYTQRIVPSGLPELIIYIDHKPTSQKRSVEEHCLLNGQHNDYYDILICKNLSLFSISFQPQGLSQFFKIPLSELTNQSVPLKYINRALSDELQKRLSEKISFRDRVHIAENYFYQLLANNQNYFEFRRLSDTIEIIRNARGIVEIDLLAQNACWSRKQFERKFLEYIGMSPKKYLKIVRFQSAVFTKSKNTALSMTELAYACGYYDQSHFINEFKILTGMTPKQYFYKENSVSDFFQ